MGITLYLITQIGFVAITVVFFGWVLKVLKNALAQSTLAADRQNKIFRNVIIALTLWMVVLSSLSIIGFFSDFSGFPPRFVIIVLVPMITLVWSLLISKTTKQLLTHIPPQTIINLQVFRVFVEILLWMLFIQNLLPVQMTFEGRNFDIIAGITAPLVAYLAYSKNLLSKNMVIAWNFICLGLLLNIVLTAIFSMPTSFRYFMNEPANTIVTQFPIIWLPGFLVPLAYGLHFLSIRQLLNQKD
ncbi:MAG: hypothetical protein RIF39_00430 [Cyclobacteriaceae bacterium]